VGPSQKPKSGSTIGIEESRLRGIVCSRARKTVSHLELNALTNGNPVKGVPEERRDMGELCNPPELNMQQQ